MLLSCVIATANAQTFAVGYLIYSVNADGVSVTVLGHIDGTEAEGSLVIPNTVSYGGTDYAVTKIGREAFANTRSLHGTLTIGNNVTEIGQAAFMACDSLSGILRIPNSVRKIGKHAFRFCERFTGDLTIPNSVDTIGMLAFERCNGFNGTLTIGSSVVFVGWAAFQLCENFTRAVSLAVQPPTKEVWYGLDYAFYNFGCSSITVPCGSQEAYENSSWLTTYGIAGAILTLGFDTIVQYCEDVVESENNLITVYPNPTSGMIRVEAENIQNVSIYNILGEKVFENEVSGDTFEYNLSSQKAGIYIIKVSLGDGTELYERIVKE